MKENIKKAYEELVEIRNGLKHAENQCTIEGYMKRLEDCLLYLQTEEDYVHFASTLRSYAINFGNGKGDLDYIVEYVSKLVELIEVKSENESPSEAKIIREEAKAACEKIGDAVQQGVKNARETIKTEGPRYASEAIKSVRDVSKRFGEGIKKILKEDESAEDGEE